MGHCLFCRTKKNLKVSRKEPNREPPEPIPPTSGELNPEIQQPVKLTTGISSSVTDNGFEDFTKRNKIKAAWFGLTDEQRIPFHELREKKAMPKMPGSRVPVELLAFQQFTQECLAGRVKI
jgi:hypothetical protein